MTNDRAGTALAQLRLVSALTAAIADADSIPSGIEATLRVICDACGWAMGQAWMPDPDDKHLVCHDVWHAHESGHEAFREASLRQTFSRGEGLVGQVWATGQAGWQEEIDAGAPSFVRARAAESSGLGAALAVPVLSEDRVAAVLEFLTSGRSLDPDARGAVAAAADTLGGLIGRKRSEARLRWDETRFRAVADTANDAIITCNAAGEVVYANRGAVELFGYPREELMLAHVTALVPQRLQRRRRDEVTRLLRTGDSYLLDNTTVLPALRRDGREVDVEASFATWRHEGTRYFTAILRDVSERERMRTELQRAVAAERATARRLRQVDALRMTFLDAVSHDLRSPLAGVVAAASLLEQQVGAGLDPERVHHLLHGITESADRMRAMLDDLLDVERLRAGRWALDRRTVDLALLVESVLSEHRRATLDGREVTTWLEPVQAQVDAPKVERIVENLVVNAAKHTPAGTPVHVAVTVHGPEAMLTCEDRGPGVPTHLHEQVFDRFSRRPDPSLPVRGTGLGLSLVQRLAELHGGAAWVEDRPGGGASFRVRLPLRGSD